MSFLTLRSLSKRYPDGTEAVRGIDLDVGPSEFVVLLGPSGCGKTTTLRMIAGLEIASGGTIGLDGREVTRLRASERDIGFVFQFYALYPHMSVAENIAFPLRCAGVSRSEREQRVQRLARSLDLVHLLPRKPRELSGGDQQRISLARAMVRKPKLYLMDEPLGTLDAEKRLELRELVRAQQQELGVATVYVTHDQEEAMSLADRVVVMRDGRILQVGSPHELYARPKSLFVARFVGSPGMNLLSGSLERADGRTLFRVGGEALELQAPPALRAGPVVLGVRPEFVCLRADGPIRGRVRLGEFLGDSRCYHLETPYGPLVARLPAGERLERGDQASFAIDGAQARLFDPQSEEVLG